VIAVNTKPEADTTVLIVDDDNVTRLTIKKILQKSGYNIADVDSGEKAIDYCIRNLPDLVLLDLMMPDLDGYETCKALRGIADYNRLPIIILTGLDDLESIDKAFNAGSTDFITKPINWPLLTQRVRYSLRTRELFHELIKSKKKLTRAHNIARIGYWEMDLKSNMVSLFDETRHLLGLQQEHYNMDDLMLHINDIDANKIRDCIHHTIKSGNPYKIDHSFINDDGIEFMMSQQGELVIRGEHQIIAGTLQDITEHKQAEDLIYFHRYHDPATALPNKEYLQKQLNDIIQTSQNPDITAIVNLSFDRLRSIGSTIGEDFINQFLRQSSERILNNISQIQSISRISTTTFGFLINTLESNQQVELICDTLIKLFNTPITINNHEYHTNISLGISLHPADSDSNNLINHAVTAQKICFLEGGNKYLLYSNDMDEYTKGKLVLENSMRGAFDNNEFYAFFQPQINTANNTITGMEALARWIDADGKIIPPDSFIPLAEETGLIIELGKEILRQSCYFAKKILDDGLGTIRVGVNLSAMQFNDKNLLLEIKKTLEDTGLIPDQLEIEITESIAMTDISHAITTLSKIRDMGIKTSMDDFGTGYSSLSYLQKLPLDTLKIDQSFIRPIEVDYKNSEIARAIIAMAQSLKMHLIAEGAEEAHHYRLLKELGCNEVQGYYFSKPLQQDQFIDYINKQTYLL